MNRFCGGESTASLDIGIGIGVCVSPLAVFTVLIGISVNGVFYVLLQYK